MAEYLVVPSAGCIPIAPEVPDTVAVLVEPLAVAVRAVRRAELTGGDRVLVIGVGAIGQCTAMLAVREAAAVSVFDHDQRRVAVLCEVSPTIGAGIRPDAEQVADCVIDCAGTPASFAAAMRAVAPGGRIILVGAAAGVEFSPLAATLKEVTIATSLSHDVELDTRPAAKLLGQRDLDLSRIVTDVVAIDDAVPTVFAPDARPRGTAIKTVIAPAGYPT
jgi:L-iditol 2-dehydrogenase